MAIQPHRQLLALDLLRCTCALAVALHHLFAVMWVHAPLFLLGKVPPVAVSIGWPAWIGWIGVEVFFVISGYVIAQSLTDARSFVERRTRRLAPAAWLCASITALITLASGGLSLGETGWRWLVAISFSPYGDPIDGSYWTLPIECAFYMLVTLGLAIARDRGAMIARVGLGLAAASAGYWLIHTGAAFGEDWERANVFLLPHGAFFAIGIALSPVSAVDRKRRALTLLIALPAAAAQIVDRSAVITTMLDTGYPAAFALLAFAAALLPIVFADRLQRPLEATFGSASLRLLGLATYPLYLIHQNVGAAVIVLLMGFGITRGVAATLALLFVGLLAIVIAQTYEPRFRTWLLALPGLTRRRGQARDNRPSASLPAG